jgi:hypothetical protein
MKKSSKSGKARHPKIYVVFEKMKNEDSGCQVARQPGRHKR